MSNPATSDHNRSTPPSSSSTPQPHPSLPARPPPSVAGPFKPASASSSLTANAAPGTASYAQQRSSTPTNVAFTAFKPRAVAGPNQEWRSQQQSISAGPAPPSAYSVPSNSPYSANHYQQPQYSAQPQYNQQYYNSYSSEATPPQIQNPFPLPNRPNPAGFSNAGRGRQTNGNYDPQMEAEIAQWQSAYTSREENPSITKTGRGVGPDSAGGANAVALGSRGPAIPGQDSSSAAKPDSNAVSTNLDSEGKQQTVMRKGGGETWSDSSLLEWDPTHFRLFVGNLAGEVTDDSLFKAFQRWESVQKAKVIRDKISTKSKGYGFVSFSSSSDYFHAFKEMNGRYIGSHPVLLRRATTDVRPTVQADKNKKNKSNNKNKGNDASHHSNASTGAGVSKKQAKTKGGLRILG